jgi:putative ABC transport system ATP-binding protein
MAEAEEILAGRGLHKSYGDGAGRVHVLRGLEVAVRRGEFLAIMGPSGCGKSTLLHLLGLMAPPDEGSVCLDGQVVPASSPARNALRRSHIGFVFQRLNLLAQLRAADDVALSLRVRGLRPDGHVAELFETLGVGHVARRKPSQMSVGEQQRVAIVRALAHRPAVVLADEPTGNLDSANTAALLELFRHVNRRDGQTIVMITHSAEAAAYADRVLRMKDGRIVGQAPDAGAAPRPREPAT